MWKWDLINIVAVNALAPKHQIINMVYSVYDIYRCEWTSYSNFSKLNKSIFEFYFYDLIQQHSNDIMIRVGRGLIPQN